MTEPRFARYADPPQSDAREAVLDQLAEAYQRHSDAESLARATGDSEAANDHHMAILLLTGMCKEAERR